MYRCFCNWGITRVHLNCIPPGEVISGVLPWTCVCVVCVCLSSLHVPISSISPSGLPLARWEGKAHSDGSLVTYYEHYVGISQLGCQLGLVSWDYWLASHDLDIVYFRGFGNQPTSLYLLSVPFWFHSWAFLVTHRLWGLLNRSC